MTTTDTKQPTTTNTDADATPSPLILTNSDDFKNAVDALPSEEQDRFWATYGRKAAVVLNAHLHNLALRSKRAGEIAKTATGMRRRRAKELKYTADLLLPRVRESATAALFTAWKETTNRELVFAPAADADTEGA